MKSTNLGNLIFDGERVRGGHLRIGPDQRAEIWYGPPSGETSPGLVIPGFVNAHTHIGDSFAYPAPKLPLADLVAPPDGYKHRSLRAASSAVKQKGMLESLDIMASTGTALFSDFREEGLEGLDTLKRLIRPGHPEAILLGRPSQDPGDPEEIERILMASNGIGTSAVSDLPMDYLKKLASAARSKGKIFSIHLSEGARENIEQVLSLHPDFVVHATKSTSEDLTALAEAKVPVVVCPRSNEFFGNEIDIPRMLASGVEVGLGTDNGMICRPDMIEEMKAAFRVSRARGGITPLAAVQMATTQGRKILKADGNTTPAEEKEHDVTVVRVPGKDPLRELVTTASSKDVLAVVREGKVRRLTDWR